MGEEQIKLTVYFEEPFWVGVFEKIEDGKLSASKVTFGAEPKDYEVYAFILKHLNDLHFSPAVATVVKEAKKNPKRMQRDIRKSLKKNGTGTKSQQALKLQHEQRFIQRYLRVQISFQRDLKSTFSIQTRSLIFRQVFTRSTT